MKGALFYEGFEAGRNRYYIDLYFKACEKRGISLRVFLLERLSFGVRDHEPFLFYDGAPFELPDFAVMRLREPLLSRQLECMGVKTFNSSAVCELTNDKRRTYQFAQTLGLPMMDTWFLTQNGAVPALPYPVVIKSARGFGGHEVRLAQSEFELREAMKSFSSEGAVAQSLASDAGKDLRVYVVGNKIACAMLRTSKGDFRSNFGLGGSAAPYALNARETDMVNRVLEHMELGLAGIDFVFHRGEAVFNEIEDVVGARMLYRYTEIDIVDRYVGHIAGALS
ncbi:MAG: ATP-grasp domain-containing protein [Clostridiaceae bacterium]